MKLLLTIFLILPVLARPQDQLECPSGYTLVIDKCLMVIKTPMRHLEAESACTYNGGTLVNIKDAIVSLRAKFFIIEEFFTFRQTVLSPNLLPPLVSTKRGLVYSVLRIKTHRCATTMTTLDLS